MASHAFRVGDKVAVYVGGRANVCSGRKVGVVREVTSFDDLLVEFCNGLKSESWLCHPKQCRRLKRKKCREWDVWVDHNGVLALVPCTVVMTSLNITYTQIRVREIRNDGHSTQKEK